MSSKSAQRQERVAARRQLRNKATRSEVKTRIGKAEKLILSGELEAARESALTAVVSLDKAAEKKILHPNNAARRKSRLMRKLNKAAVASSAGTETKPAA